jgi:hypothetical protein
MARERVDVRRDGGEEQWSRTKLTRARRSMVKRTWELYSIDGKEREQRRDQTCSVQKPDGWEVDQERSALTLTRVILPWKGGALP